MRGDDHTRKAVNHCRQKIQGNGLPITTTTTVNALIIFKLKKGKSNRNISQEEALFGLLEPCMTEDALKSLV
jgi:hypothetical protein